MGLLQNLQVFVIKLVCWLGWLSSFALAQLDISEGMSGFVNISVQGITCLGNLAVFVTSLIRGRLDLEIGARDALDILLSAKLKTINGIEDGNGLITEQTASAEQVPIGKMFKFFGRLLHGLGIRKMFESFGRRLDGLGIKKMVDLFKRLRHRLGIQKMVELFRRLRNRLVIQKMVELFRRLRLVIQKMVELFRQKMVELFRRLRLVIQKMVELFRRLRHRVGIHIPCFREEEDLETASAGGGPSASNENGSVQNASVVMLCNGKPNLSIKEFMKTNASIVGSILLRFLPLQDAIKDREVVPPEVTIEMCGCNYCNCIVFWTIEEITNMLSLRIPGTLKRLSNSLCLLPCLTCLTNGCHACNWDSLLPLVQDDEGYKVRVNESKVVSEILDDISAGSSINGKGHICICIPVNDAERDKWTELLVRSLRSKDAESRGVRVMASEALEDYLAGRKGASSKSVEDNMVEYNLVSFIFPRLIEVIINLSLTFGFGMDGFSSALVARRTIRDYLVDSKGSGFAANAFLTKAVVKFDFQVVCQVLTFRGDLLGIKTLSFIACCVNLICSIAWVVVTVFVYVTAITPSQHVLIALAVAIGIAWCMDSISILTRLTPIAFRVVYILFAIWILMPYPYVKYSVFCAVVSVLIVLVLMWPSSNAKDKMFLLVIFIISLGVASISQVITMLLWALALCGTAIAWLPFNSMERVFILVIILESAYLQITIYRDLNDSWKSGRWVYGAVQILVWVKWTSGSYILSKKNSLEFFGKSPHHRGLLLYSSAFFLNAVLAGVRSEWKTPWIYSISREHHHRNTTTEGFLSATP